MTPAYRRKCQAAARRGLLKARDRRDSRPVEELWAELDELDRASLCDRINTYLFRFERDRKTSALPYRLLTDVLISLTDLEAV